MASKHFSGAAIGLALDLWSAGWSAAEVRKAVNTWRVGGAHDSQMVKRTATARQPPVQ